MNENVKEKFADYKLHPESYYLTSTGIQMMEQDSCLLLELANPLGSDKLIYLSMISGGGMISTTIEMILNGSLISQGTPMLASTFNTTLGIESVAWARFSIEGVDSTPGDVIWTSIQANKMANIDFNGQLIIAPGQSLIVRMMIRARKSSRVCLNLSWRE